MSWRWPDSTMRILHSVLLVHIGLVVLGDLEEGDFVATVDRPTDMISFCVVDLLGEA